MNNEAVWRKSGDLPVFGWGRFFIGRIAECEDSKVSCHILGFLTFRAKSDLVGRDQQKDAKKTHNS